MPADADTERTPCGAEQLVWPAHKDKRLNGEHPERHPFPFGTDVGCPGRSKYSPENALLETWRGRTVLALYCAGDRHRGEPYAYDMNGPVKPVKGKDQTGRQVGVQIVSNRTFHFGYYAARMRLPTTHSVCST